MTYKQSARQAWVIILTPHTIALLIGLAKWCGFFLVCLMLSGCANGLAQLADYLETRDAKGCLYVDSLLPSTRVRFVGSTGGLDVAQCKTGGE